MSDLRKRAEQYAQGMFNTLSKDRYLTESELESITNQFLAFAAAVSAERIAEDARRIEILQYELAKSMAMFDRALNTLVAISALAHPDGFIVNGKGYTFHPPDALVRETWEAMSKAIRDIDINAIVKEPT